MLLRNGEVDLHSRSEAIEFITDISCDGMSCGDFLRQCGVSRRLVTKLKRVPMGITRGGELKIRTTACSSRI